MLFLTFRRSSAPIASAQFALSPRRMKSRDVLVWPFNMMMMTMMSDIRVTNGELARCPLSVRRCERGSPGAAERRGELHLFAVLRPADETHSLLPTFSFVYSGECEFSGVAD
jgi:hypothetical protein